MALNMAALQSWQRAAARALAADLPHQLRQRGQSIVVPSKSEAGAVYHVQVSGGLVGTCSCPAGLLGKPCAHRAAVAIRLHERRYGCRLTAIKPGGIKQMEDYLRA